MKLNKTICLCALAVAGLAEAASDTNVLTRLHFAAKAIDPIVLDGRLDEATWKAAVVIDDFARTYDRKPSFTPRTEVRFAWDDQYLYVAAMCDEETPDNFKSFSEMLNDPLRPGDNRDHLAVHLGAYCYYLNGSAEPVASRKGNYNEDFLLRTPFEERNFGLGSDWNSAVKIDGFCWTVEARIALADIEVNPKDGKLIVMDVNRVRYGKQQYDAAKKRPCLGRSWQSHAWNARYRDPTFPSNYGRLALVEKLPSPEVAAARRAEVDAKRPAANQEKDRERFLKLRDEIVRTQKVTEPVILNPPADAPALNTEEPQSWLKPQDRRMPFVTWGKPLARRPKVFISISGWGSYDAWALTNRLDIDASIYQIKCSPWVRGIAGKGDEFSENLWRYDLKRAELLRALKEGGEFDAFFFVGCGPANWPADLQCWLLERTLAGAVIVVENDEGGDPLVLGTGKNVLGMEQAIPTDLAEYVRDLAVSVTEMQRRPVSPVRTPLSVVRFGKGSLWTFETNRRGGWVHRAEVTPGWATLPDDPFADEYAFAYATKIFMHALGVNAERQVKDVSKGLAKANDEQPATVALHTDGAAFAGKLGWTLRDSRGNIVRESPLREVSLAAGAVETKLDLGRLAVGRYTVDVTLYDRDGMKKDFASAAIHVQSANDVRFAEVKLAKRMLPDPSVPVQATCRVKGATAGLSVRAEIRDVRNRVLAWREFPVDAAKGTAEISLPQIKDYDWTCAYLDVTLQAGARKLDAQSLAFFRRKTKLSDYSVFTGGPQMGGYMGAARLAIIQYYGIDLCQGDTNPLPIYYGSDLVFRDRIPGSFPDPGGALTNPWYIDWCTRHFRRDAEGLYSLNGRWLSLGDDSRVPYGFAKTCPDFVPVWMEMQGRNLVARHYGDWKKELTNATGKVAADWLKAIRTAYPTVEHFNLQCGTALRDWKELQPAVLKTIRPAPMPEFCNFIMAMKAKYGDIAKLNAAWGTELASFTNITERIISNDPKAKSYVPFVDRQVYLENAFVAQCRAIAAGVRAVDTTIGLGFGATNLGNNQADAMKYVDTVCPYAGISPAIEAARVFKPRYVGETMGIYGGRVVPKYFRERTVWHGLLNGNTFAWFWDASFIGGDLTIEPSRMGWMLETIREIKRGPAALCLRSRRENDGIRMLLSRNSGHFNFVGTLRTNHEQSGKAFYRTLESLGHQFDAISSEQLENGELAGAKMLILPYALSLTPREVERIRAFVSAGGTVLADFLPGVFETSGLRNDAPLLNDVFGVKVEGDPLRAAYESVSLSAFGGRSLTLNKALVDASVRATTATVRGKSAAGSAAFFDHAFGKGRAVLLNFNLASLPFLMGNDTTEVAYAMMSEVFEQAVGKSPFVLRERSRKIVTGAEFSRFTRGSHTYLGVEKVPHLNEGPDAYPREVTLEFDHFAHVYDVRAGRYLGRTMTVPLTLNRFHEGLYALLPYQVGELAVEAPASVRRGTSIQVRASVKTVAGKRPDATHVFRVELIPEAGYAPDRFMTFPTRVLDAPHGEMATSFPMAFNDRAGEIWTLIVTDAATGVSATRKISVE